ncbi:carboxypeptidase M32 [Fusibacillus kribbianus]|uniref:Metal-dependent carboxypeptidase n=1 Tax=Fusibacillus kribbianus TaxID=3044208 RepID=A0AAP4B9P7_9FIRM|nr:carboxypeptidase M32 [Ruminococcus sp. YH-rum2234]MDI9241665.1 carboxypeptidase M32 [Ruminococcus sp. YH-rum2234]
MEQKAWKAFSAFLEEENALRTALTLFDWDNETLAPAEASERTSRAVGVLSSSYQELLICENTGKLLKQVKECDELTKLQAAIVRQVEKERERLLVIPEEEYRRFSELTAVSVGKWSQAKKNNDFASFAPVLSEILEMRKKFAAYRAKEGEPLYDVLLSDYEEGFTTEKLDDFFGKLKREIVPLVQWVREQNRKKPITSAFLFQNYDIEKQKRFSRWLAACLGFDFSRGVLAESEHPFTTALHRDDVRITTHYYANNLESAIFSTIHETGHGLFEQGNDEAVTQTPIGGGSCGVHESQSRFYENMLGRSRAFWKPVYGKLTKTFPEQLSNISLDEFVRAINRSEPGLLRTESDELSYCLHIIVRYELEKQLLEGTLSVKELPKEWKKLYEEYLGVSPETDGEGVLQDIHWAMGEFGYFPSYALGNAMAAQIYAHMNQEMNVEELLEKGELAPVTGYLREHIHRYGASKNMEELCQELTGEELNPVYYTRYLREKFETIYG